VLYAVSAVLTAVICGPFFGGYLLHRDAVATPRLPLSAAAFGIDGAPPRAVPQDAVLGVLSRVVDGGLLVALITAGALLAAGIGYGRLAQALVPGCGGAGAAAAAMVAIWNPYVAERLLQGHWSLLTGYAALGWLILAVRRLAAHPSWRDALITAGLLAAAGLTPTGSLLGLGVAVLTAAVTTGRRRAAFAVVLGGWLVTALPWLVAAAAADDSTRAVGGGALFAARAEPWLGTLGSVAGLGGIWNAEAVPAGRRTGWALAATAALLLLVALGCRELWRGRARTGAMVPALAGLAAVTVLLIGLAATGPGLAVMDALLTSVPGAGLLRDTQKFAALAVPFFALAAAAAASALRRWVPSGFAVAAVALLVVAPLPELAWGVGGGVRPVSYPDDYARVTELIGRTGTGVAVWPDDTVRRFPWNHGPSLSPLPRIIDAAVLTGGALVVDGQAVDAPTERGAAVGRVLADGGDPQALARLNVGWVIVENAAPPPLLAAHGSPVYSGRWLTVFAVDGAGNWPAPGAGIWAAAIAALSLWFAALIGGLGAAVGRAVQSRSASTRCTPSAVDSQE